MCTVLLPPGGYPIPVNEYIISYHISNGKQVRKTRRPLDGKIKLGLTDSRGK